MRKDSPGCATLGSAAAAEHEHLGSDWPTDFAREDALATVVYVQEADLAGATAAHLEERGVGQPRVVLLQRGDMAGEKRSTLLFARTRPVEVCVANDLSVGGQEAFHTICCLAALSNSRNRRDWVPPRPAGVVSRRLLDVGCHREFVSRSCRRLLARQPPTPGLCVRRAASNFPDQTGTSHRHICLALGIEVRATAASVFWELSNHVEQLGREKIHPVFLLDEAQLLRDQVLEHLHILSNYAWDQKPLLSVVLLGLPDLWRKLSLGIHRSLWSRIHCRIALEPPSPEDTVEYITHRIQQADGKASVFVSDARALIHEATNGQLRDIDRVATACLRLAARRKLKTIDRELLQDVVDTDSSPD